MTGSDLFHLSQLHLDASCRALVQIQMGAWLDLSQSPRFLLKVLVSVHSHPVIYGWEHPLVALDGSYHAPEPELGRIQPHCWEDCTHVHYSPIESSVSRGLSPQSETDAEIETVPLRFQATPRPTMSWKQQATYWQVLHGKQLQKRVDNETPNWIPWSSRLKMVRHRGLIVSMSKSDYMQGRNFVLGSVCGASIAVRKADDFWCPRAGWRMKIPPSSLRSGCWVVVSGLSIALRLSLETTACCSPLHFTICLSDCLQWSVKKEKNVLISPSLSLVPSPSLTQSNMFFFLFLKWDPTWP